MILNNTVKTFLSYKKNGRKETMDSEKKENMENYKLINS